LEAQAGRTDVKGTIGPSAACEFWETVKDRRERRNMIVVDCISAVLRCRSKESLLDQELRAELRGIVKYSADAQLVCPCSIAMQTV